MKTAHILLAAACIATSASALAAPNEGLYVAASLGQAHTSLDTSNTMHATTITSDSTNKLGLGLALGYRFNQHIGAELAYVDFGKPTYDLVRGTSGEVSQLTVQNTALVLSAVGYLPLNEAFTLTGKAGAAFVHTKVDRVGAPGHDDTYHVSDDQLHPTFGIGATYKLSSNLDLRMNLDWYPKITKTNDNATDTNAYMLGLGLQYNF
ncbi:outer membrane beta-barrel protein [Herbaspirillum sp.]|uniref:outer membrane beta-barrel protein n=1 Tax=Herbaspirillum sp. TaxID=1890675 RepID=UPI001B17569C|nr:outer membrane beta-barrel protein [Herbaspirillum sp.]MBO9538881.1 outer membrane beta-barrel protein [Herbaspirillum sp.]